MIAPFLLLALKREEEKEEKLPHLLISRRSSLRCTSSPLHLGLFVTFIFNFTFIPWPLLTELLELVAHFKQQHWEDVNAE